MTTKHDSASTHLLEHAKQLYHECKFDESEKTFAELGESASQKDMGHYGVGLIRFQLGSLEHAGAEFEKCLKENPTHADACFYLGQICRLRNEPGKAVVFWLKALTIEPKHASASRQLYLLSGSMLAHARRLYNQHKFKASAEAFEKVIKLGRHGAEGHYGLGLVFFQLGSLDLARKELETCVKLNARHANAWFYLGEIARKRNALEESRRFFQKALEISPNHAGAKRRLLNLLESERKMPLRPGTQTVPPGRPLSQVAAGGSAGVPLPQEAAQLMESLRMSGVQPIISAYLGKILLRLLACVVVFPIMTIFMDNTFFRGSHKENEGMTVTAILLLVLLIGYLLWYIFKILSTRINLDHGRLSITKGISARQTDIPLANIQNVEIQRTMLNRITDDGTIVLYLAPDQGQVGNPPAARIDLIGLAKFARLSQIVEGLKALIPLLRTNSTT
jgi:tetratricopeptide (TPR) repeat protein